MELKEFIKGVLTEIVEAQSEFNQEMDAQNKKVKVCKYPLVGESAGPHEAVTLSVSFDLKLSLKKNSDSKSAIGVVAGIIGSGINKVQSSEDESENRLSFEMPLTFNCS